MAKDTNRAKPTAAEERPAPGWLRENALGVAGFVLFALSLIGQIAAGYLVHAQDLNTHGGPRPGLLGYLTSGHFVEALFENWESEFLQIGLFVLLTKYLRQKGSSESKPPDGKEEVDEDPRNHRAAPGAPWPVRRGGWVLFLYERSLSISLFLLFFLSLVGHAIGGRDHHNEELARHGQTPESLGAYLTGAQFWFESLQNWQSEFLSVFALITLSIFLRERGSPQSKPVHAPHTKTGE